MQIEIMMSIIMNDCRDKGNLPSIKMSFNLRLTATQADSSKLNWKLDVKAFCLITMENE